jgi:hypothetical protein
LSDRTTDRFAHASGTERQAGAWRGLLHTAGAVEVDLEERAVTVDDARQRRAGLRANVRERDDVRHAAAHDPRDEAAPVVALQLDGDDLHPLPDDGRGAPAAKRCGPVRGEGLEISRGRHLALLSMSGGRNRRIAVRPSASLPRRAATRSGTPLLRRWRGRAALWTAAGAALLSTDHAGERGPGLAR